MQVWTTQETEHGLVSVVRRVSGMSNAHSSSSSTRQECDKARDSSKSGRWDQQDARTPERTLAPHQQAEQTQLSDFCITNSSSAASSRAMV